MLCSNWIKIIPSSNCYRFYRILLEGDLFAAWRVRCEWGRLGARHTRQLVRVFDDECAARAYLLVQERERQRRGYQLTA